ncbi:MAG: CRISPR-associated helicase Cas3' [bacterium]
MKMKEIDTLYAHSSENGNELLEEHLENVARRAGQFAKKFGAESFGYAAGFLHDLGKAKPAFQRKLQGERNSEPHSGEGALYACKHYEVSCPGIYSKPLGRMLAFVIAGHHCGLANGQAQGGRISPLDERLTEAKDIDPWFDRSQLPDLRTSPPFPLQKAGLDPFGWSFFIRMLFSALVDADRLETEKWAAQIEGKAVNRGWNGQLSNLKKSLDRHLASFDPAKNELATLRAEVLADCRSAAQGEQGLFSLTVPTGGGKTLSSLAFALEHAIKHNLDRVIYVIPFTSIVDQTTKVFRHALADDNAILEHHSNFVTEKLSGENDEDNDHLRRLAAQNWDRPIIVTTAVQFFESLFSNKPGRCRKLHNIARSVVVLDEAQTLPLKLLRPCLAALNELQRGYNTSIVLCTATQPALTKEAGLNADEALENVHEIVKPQRNLYERLKRVRTELVGVMSDEKLVEALGKVQSGLCIVNNRRHARELFEMLESSGIEGAYHLTTAMTGAHRRMRLEQIRRELKQASPVRLVSTSLIEAGVDISFAAVWRASAGLDQIAQAAGRCNRENELDDGGGLLTVFEPEEGDGRNAPPELKQFAETAKRVLRKDEFDDPLSQEAVAAYFRELLWVKSSDNSGKPKQLDAAEVGEAKIHGIMRAIEESAPGMNFRFADIGQAFRMIESNMIPIIIPDITSLPGVGAPTDLIDLLRLMETAGSIARKLQPHLVQVPRQALTTLCAASAVEVIQKERFGDQFVLLTNLDLYKSAAGLNWDDPEYRNIENDIL